MVEIESHLERNERHARRRRRDLVFVSSIVGGLVLLAVASFGTMYGPALWAVWSYEPREGDVVFQSLPRSPLVNAIEGSTGSPWSHCGLVVRDEDGWYVYEALDGVERTPLNTFLWRSRDQRWAAYRLDGASDRETAAIRAEAERFLGRPYDSRYRWDDEAIYCSELIAKSHEAATGRPLGRRVPLGSLDWKPFEATIRALEGGSLPLERRMLTPRDLAAAPELVHVAGSR